MATYNRRHLVAVAIRSVLAQTYPHLELVLVNDGGEDIRDIVDRFGDPRIRYFCLEKNRGAGHAYNFGIRQSRGEYIGHMDDDDEFYPNHLETLVPHLEQRPDIDLAYSDIETVQCELHDGAYTNISGRKVEYSFDFDRIVLIALTNYIVHTSVLHRAQAAGKAGWYDESLRCLIDYDFLRRLAFYSDFLHVKAVTGAYYQPRNTPSRVSSLFHTDRDQWVRCMQTAFGKRPPGPWKGIRELTVVLYARRFGLPVIHRINDLLKFAGYPMNLFVVIDEYSDTAAGTLTSTGLSFLTPIVNSSPRGLKHSLRDLRDRLTAGGWAVIVTEESRIDDGWFGKLSGQMRARMSGSYTQPAAIRTDELYVDMHAAV
jgi:glycosyltransferase involved in cell wall biosynthesis